MSSGLCCCSPCRPAYKRHVDSIYPEVPEAGLVKPKMEALVYYAMTSPEKLDRIGEYLATKISRDIYRNRKELVFIGLEAIDQLLSACHVRTINLFIESYLKTIQRLLESPDADFQILASKSFLHFSKIKEETPSYHRTYDFFIDRFSQMCHSNVTVVDVTGKSIREKLRVAGLEGISGVIRKSINEDLADNIWDSKHMELIVPSLLFNMEDTSNQMSNIGDLTDLDSEATENTPSHLSDQILRELVQAATSISIKAFLIPVLTHIDNHNQWDADKQDFAVHIFNAIMYSIQVDLSYILIENIIAHIDSASNITQKGNIATVLSKIIHIGVGESTVGPAVLEIITSLLRHLTSSVDAGYSLNKQSSSSEPMLQFQAALFRCLGEYTGKMPDFQKSENMSFILSKIPVDAKPDGERRMSSEVQLILMKALFAVAEKHTATLFSSNFNSHLLRLLMANDPNVRLLVLQTFQILADRNDNMGKLLAPTLTPSDLDLYGIPGRKNRTDHVFAQKTLFRIYAGFKQVLAEHNNSKEFLDAMYTTVAILAVEMSATDEGTMCLLDLIDGIQTTAVNELALSTNNRFNLHSLAILLFALLAMIVSIPDIDIYLDDVIKVRKTKAAHMLPPITETYNPGLDPNTPDDDVLINVDTVKEDLRSAGKDIEQMGSLPILGGQGSRLNNWQDNSAYAMSSRRSSSISVSTIAIDFGGSNASSPGFSRKPIPEEMSVKVFKRILDGTPANVKDEQLKKKKDMQTRYLYSMWEDLCTDINKQKKPDLQDLQEDILNKLSFGENVENGGNIQTEEKDHRISIMDDKQPFGRYFPEIYLY